MQLRLYILSKNYGKKIQKEITRIDYAPKENLNKKCEDPSCVFKMD